MFYHRTLIDTTFSFVSVFFFAFSLLATSLSSLPLLHNGLLAFNSEIDRISNRLGVFIIVKHTLHSNCVGYAETKWFNDWCKN